MLTMLKMSQSCINIVQRIVAECQNAYKRAYSRSTAVEGVGKSVVEV